MEVKDVVIAGMSVTILVLVALLIGLAYFAHSSREIRKDAIRDRELLINSYQRITNTAVSSCRCPFSKAKEELEKDFHVHEQDAGPVNYVLSPKDEEDIRTDVWEFFGVGLETSNGDIEGIFQHKP